MVERTSKRGTSPDHGSSITSRSKLKRKKASQQSPESSPKQSDSSPVGNQRPKKARKPARHLESNRFTAESPSKDKINTTASEGRKHAVPKTPSPNGTDIQRCHTLSESPTRVVVHDLTQPSSAATASESPDIDNLKSSPRASSTSKAPPSPDVLQPHLLARRKAWSYSNTLRPSPREMSDTKRQGTDWPGPSTQQFGYQSLVPYNTSAVGTTAGQMNTLTPMMLRQSQEVKRQQSMVKLFQESQLRQEAQFATSHRVMLQKTQDYNPNGDFFFYRGTMYTLRECLLACSLKIFCKVQVGQQSEGLSDDTIGEILQYQRGWSVPNGLDCQGMCAALIREESKTRVQIEDSIRGDHPRWENYAWRSYQGWKNAMRMLVDRLKRDGLLAAIVSQGLYNPSNFNGINDHRHRQQVSRTRAEHIGHGSYTHGYLPMANIAAAIGRKELHSDKELILAGFAGSNLRMVGNMRMDSKDTSDGDPSHSRLDHREEYLLQMETATDEGSFGLE